VWRRGSVVASWLLDLTAAALQESPSLERILRTRQRLGRGPLDGECGDRRRAYPRRLIASALFDRFISQQEADFANQLLSAMRKQFGGPRGEKPPAGE